MGNYAVGDIVDASTVNLNRFDIKNADQNSAGVRKLKIVEIPSKGKPVAVVQEWGDRTGSDNDLLGGHL
ncbi:hypothetical protein ACFQL1_16220 [Halomicroarcula sp. GCM10025709]|uniref:hypothetical protein n=1 Tax=Haloarcula TaxID=2237 RepID=UPI0024C3AA4A|nr:hypothetical protein [Halomicroarcula sp. YJ-61-S]